MKVSDLEKVNILFKRKEWKKGAFFDRYCRFLENFEDDEKELLLELSDNLLCISLENYLTYLEELLSKLFLEEKEFMEKIKKVYVMPLLALNNEIYSDKITKSSNFISYLFQSCEILINSFLKEKKMRILENCYEWEKIKKHEERVVNKVKISKKNKKKRIKLLKKKIDYNYFEKIKNNEVYIKKKRIPSDLNEATTLLIVVDDFIGTGETAVESLNFIKDNFEIKNNNIRILALAIQKNGFERLKEYKIKIYYSHLLKKGITEYYDSNIVSSKIELMKKIEKKIGVKEKEKFGYNGSEALIRLIRTPNNTFPVFHKENKNKNKNAIFPRR